MKKTLKKLVLIILFLSLFILFSATKSSADMGAPVIQSYEATISNVNGATYYKYGDNGKEKAGILNYGEKVEIIYEEELEDLYGVFYEDNNFYSYFIKLSDIEIINEGKDFTEGLNLDSPREIEILAEEGLEIYKGPAYGHSKTGIIIPKGTILKGYYYADSDNPWYYVKYKNTKGFISTLDGNVGIEKGDTKLLTYKAVNIYDSVRTEGKDGILGRIPANTFIDDYKNIDAWSQAYYVTYKGVSGYVSYYDIASESYYDDWKYEVNYGEAKMYKEGNIESEVLIDSIPMETELEILYCNDLRAYGWIYTTYKGVSGWVVYCDTEESYQYFLDSSNENYEEEEEIIDEDYEEDDEDYYDEEEYDDEDYDDEELEDEDIIPVPNFKLQIVLLCILVAVISSLTSFVTIVLVNYKKDKKAKKEDEVKEDKKEQ